MLSCWRTCWMVRSWPSSTRATHGAGPLSMRLQPQNPPNASGLPVVIWYFICCTGLLSVAAVTKNNIWRGSGSYHASTILWTSKVSLTQEPHKCGVFSSNFFFVRNKNNTGIRSCLNNLCAWRKKISVAHFKIVTGNLYVVLFPIPVIKILIRQCRAADLGYLIPSVSDPHWLYADPDPAF
jgi:hypothetical protein